VSAEFTDEARERLKDKLDAIGKAREPLMVAIKPLNEALLALAELEEMAVEEAGVELLDEICEGCERMLIVGDHGHRAADGPVMCEACSPTYADVLSQYEDATDRASLLVDLDLTEEELADQITSLKAMVAAGDGDKKNVVPL
jgi:hypothetical protein